MKNDNDNTPKKHSKKEHIHPAHNEKLNPTSVKQEEQGMQKRGGRFGKVWGPNTPKHK